MINLLSIIKELFSLFYRSWYVAALHGFALYSLYRRLFIAGILFEITAIVLTVVICWRARKDYISQSAVWRAKEAEHQKELEELINRQHDKE